jgi:hypothetical protein
LDFSSAGCKNAISGCTRVFLDCPSARCKNFVSGLLGFLCPGVFLDFPSAGCKNFVSRSGCQKIHELLP